MKRIQDQTSSDRQLAPEQADRLLNHILDDLHLEYEIGSGRRKRKYRRIAVRRYAVKRAAAAACAVLLIVLLAPGTVVPASVSHVSAAPATDSSSVQISFQVDTLIPVQDVTAQINERSLSVESSGYQQYQVMVEENGYLLLDIYSVTGMHTSHGMEITGIDSEAPVIVSHERQDNLILIYVSDGDGVGVDYNSISARTSATEEPVSPAWCDEISGCIAFAVPEEPILIQIPDKNGNYRVLSLSHT